tara:strand:+ start:517 stop:999 length:483 start_codon:yes stop_codon:yes gene_type:complete
MKSTEDYLKDLDDFFDSLPDQKEQGALEYKILEDFHGNPPIINQEMIGKLPTLTKKAKEYIVNNMTEESAFMFSVNGGGCSGFNYSFEVVDTSSITDNEINISNNPLAFVDKQSLQFVAGASIDIKVTGLTTAFTVTNPGAKASCGCGTSFAYNEKLLIP